MENVEFDQQKNDYQNAFNVLFPEKCFEKIFDIAADETISEFENRQYKKIEIYDFDPDTGFWIGMIDPDHDLNDMDDVFYLQEKEIIFNAMIFEKFTDIITTGRINKL